MHHLVLNYDKPLIRRAVRAFWWRVVGFRFLAAVALLVIALVLAFLVRDASWVTGVTGTLLVLGVAFTIALYVIHYRNALQKLADMGKPQATLDATASSFSLSSGAGSATLPWSAVTEVWQFESCWLMFLSKAQFVTLPVADMTPESALFILDRVRDAGGKVG